MKSMTIGMKLYASFGAALALIMLVSAGSLVTNHNLSASLDKVINVNARKASLAGDLNATMSDLVSLERGITARAYMNDKATIEKYNQQFREAAARAQKAMEEFAPLTETAEGKRLLEDLRSEAERIQRVHEEFYRLASNGQREAAVALFVEQVLPAATRARATADRLIVQQSDLMAAVGKTAESSASASRWITIFLVALSLFVAGGLIVIVRQTNGSLRRIVAELSQGAEQTASAASQISASSQSLAQGASEQAAAVEETSASSEEINSMARKNIDNSRQAAELVAQSQQKFTETNQSLEQMVMAMTEIKSSSDRISKIIKTIDEIAFQTNILALNAAVEAARAGEAGMGFAVVADEVRNLAQRCAQAAKDTAALIEDSIARSNDGKTKVDQVALAIHAITEASSGVRTLVDEVNLGGQEQARGIEQIGKAISQIEQVTQKTAANAEECASASEELNAQSQTLKDVVEHLSAMVGGGDGMARQTAPPRARTVAGRPADASPRPRRPEMAPGAWNPQAVPALKSNGHAAAYMGRPDKDPLPLEEEFRPF